MKLAAHFDKLTFVHYFKHPASSSEYPAVNNAKAHMTARVEEPLPIQPLNVRASVDRPTRRFLPEAYGPSGPGGKRDMEGHNAPTFRPAQVIHAPSFPEPTLPPAGQNPALSPRKRAGGLPGHNTPARFLPHASTLHSSFVIRKFVIPPPSPTTCRPRPARGRFGAPALTIYANRTSCSSICSVHSGGACHARRQSHH
jgi:hypothetical protein